MLMYYINPDICLHPWIIFMHVSRLGLVMLKVQIQKEGRHWWIQSQVKLEAPPK